MIVFGQNIHPDFEDPEKIHAIVATARVKSSELHSTPIAEIVEVLGKLGEAWTEDGPWFARGLKILDSEGSRFTPEMNRLSLKILPELLKPRALARRIMAEFTAPEMLDRFVRRFPWQARLRAEPLGVLWHVTAGNVFLGAIDSLIMAFLTKNASIIKTASGNRTFPLLFAESLKSVDQNGILSDKYAILNFRGGDERIEPILKRSVNGVVVWGSGNALKGIREGLSEGIRLIEFGPRLSLQVVTKDGLESEGLLPLSRRLAEEICLWDQSACASPQNLFLQDGVDTGTFMKALGEALKNYPYPRGLLSPDEMVEMHKESALARLLSHQEEHEFLQGTDYMIHLDPRPGIRPSPLFRTLLIKPFEDVHNLAEQLHGYGEWLQSCSLCTTEAERHEYLEALAKEGIDRFSGPGEILKSRDGSPHDGMFCLTRMIRFVSDEMAASALQIANEAIRKVPFYRNLKHGIPVQNLDEMPLISKEMLEPYPLHESRELLSSDAQEGYIFASGGTTSSPRYTFFTSQEFHEVASLLASSYLKNGLKPGVKVANLFVAGSLWSSFLAVDKALSQCQTIQLPLGGLAEPAFILKTLSRFEVDAVFGLPTLLLNLADLAEIQGLKIHIPAVFYAGEMLRSSAREKLARVFGTQIFASAGYASVDAGPIGWQCPESSPGIHHLFADQVHLEVVEEEAVITSLIKHSMPVIRYRTGDRIRLIEEPCPCGAKDPLFELLGRVDDVLLFASCRILHSELAELMQEVAPDSLWQAEVHSGTDGRDQIRIACRTDLNLEPDELARHLLKHCRDLRATLCLDDLAPVVEWSADHNFQPKTNPRTGKSLMVVDLRLR